MAGTSSHTILIDDDEVANEEMLAGGDDGAVAQKAFLALFYNCTMYIECYYYRLWCNKEIGAQH